MTLPLRSPLRATDASVFVALALLLGSCQKRSEYAEVTGKVIYDGHPVTAGAVYFVAEGDPEASGGGPLGPDGSFKCSAPVGKVKMAIQTTTYKPKAKEPPSSAPSGPGSKSGPPVWATKGVKKEPSRPPSTDAISKTGTGGGEGREVGTKYTSIPDKYETVEGSGLTFDVSKGGTGLGEIKLTGEAKKP